MANECQVIFTLYIRIHLAYNTWYIYFEIIKIIRTLHYLDVTEYKLRLIPSTKEFIYLLLTRDILKIHLSQI